jgi:hypothetical protein
MIAHRQARRIDLRLAESLLCLGKDFPRQHGIVDGACPMTALPAVGLGCTSLGMTATSAHDKDPLLERQKSPNRNAGISAHIAAAVLQNHSY